MEMNAFKKAIEAFENPNLDTVGDHYGYLT